MDFLVRAYRRYILPTSILIGAIIGAGVFSLPYVFGRAGISVGVFYLLLSTLVYVVLHLLYADIIIRTPGRHRFVGYAKMYGGRLGYWVGIFAGILQMILVLAAYLLLIQDFLVVVSPDGYQFVFLILFWVLGSLPIFFNVRAVAGLEFLMTGGILAIILLLFFIGLFRGDPSHLFIPGRIQYFFLPLAPILFSLSGRVAVGEVVDYFKGLKGRMNFGWIRQSITWGTIIPAFLYLLFIFGALFLSAYPSEDTLSGLSSVLSWPLLILLGVLGILAIWSSYIMVGVSVEETLRDDFRFHILTRVSVVVLLPIVILFMGLGRFLGFVSFIGGVLMSIEGMLLLILWRRSRRVHAETSFLRPAPFSLLVILFIVFLVAFFYQLSTFFL